jgi:hypothetical protein
MQASYATEKSFLTYIDYLALKRHFTTDSYDYHKYNGKVKASFDSFQTRKDLFFFYKLSQKRNCHNLMLSNIVLNPSIWVRDLIDEEAEEVYLKWKGKLDSLSYHISQELETLDDNYKKNFVVSNGQHPYILTLYLQKKISLETFSIVTHTANVFTYWDKEIVDKVVAYDKIRLSKKYYPFLDFDRKKVVTVIKNHFNFV